MKRPVSISFFSLRLSAMLTALILAGCSVTPVYERPSAAAPAAFKEALASDPAWKAAQPSEHETRGPWWQVFNDSVLDDLQVQAAAANQNLKAGVARLAQSRALEQNARAGLFPQIGIGAGPTRQKPSPASLGLAPDASTTSSTLWRGQATVAYEADLFGRVGATVEAASADLQRDSALFHSLQLAIQADVAQAYFLVRELDAAAALYASTVDFRDQSLKLLSRRFEAGDIGEVDVARARTELSAAQSEALGIARRRAVAEHALAILLGRAPADFNLASAPIQRLAVLVPVGVPSTLLERRPDIAAAERAMASANARIGAAKAAFYPSLTLTAAAGAESNRLGDLFKWSSRTFLLGPLAGTVLSLPLFDGGARRAELQRADAVYEEEVARYRQTVLSAFGEVEDNLASLRLLDRQIAAQDQAVDASRRASRLSQIQYREGSVSFLDVIDADRSVLLQQRVGVQLDGERARATVGLIRAIGGGWVAPGAGNAALYGAK